jgi:hypothetical protein
VNTQGAVLLHPFEPLIMQSEANEGDGRQGCIFISRPLYKEKTPKKRKKEGIELKI